MTSPCDASDQAPAASAAPLCLVINPSAQVSYTSFPNAVTNASSGATLVVYGSCTGTSDISQNLTVIGQSRLGFTTPPSTGPGRAAP